MYRRAPCSPGAPRHSRALELSRAIAHGHHEHMPAKRAVTCIYIYEDEKYEETLTLVDDTSPYALTGAVFAKEQIAIDLANRTLEYAAGNFYINDKPTGAVVGQQPFGGGRASGTNDKAGSYLNLLRWVSPRTIKEVYNTPKDYRYPFMD